MSEVLNLKFNGGSVNETCAYFDGTNDCYLSAPDHADWDFAENTNFTIDFYWRYDLCGIMCRCP